MSYRHNILDIIVGIGMCAIVFGALLFFAVANGTFQAAIPQPVSIEQSTDTQFGMTFLQPVIGRAIVDQVLLERRANQVMAQSTAEWNRATFAYHEFQSLPGGPFGAIMRQADAIPADHMARVQGIMGRAIVNFTWRGIRSGVLSAEQSLSDYNASMIRSTEARGQRLHDDFVSTWQATLGRGIVDAIQSYTNRADAIQEQLGVALVHLAKAQTELEAARAAQQEHLGSLIVAAIRTDDLRDQIAQLAVAESKPLQSVVAFYDTVSLPQIPMGYLVAASVGLVAIFFGGLTIAATIRERKTMEEMNRNSTRWVYRMAA